MKFKMETPNESLSRLLTVDTNLLRQKLSAVGSLLDAPHEKHKPINQCQSRLSEIFMNPRLMGNDT